MAYRKKLINIGLIIGVLILTIVPLLIHSNAEFAGSDGTAKEMIQKVNPDYKPWFHNIWEPPSGEIETLLFSLQAAIGSGILFFILGYLKGKKDGKTDSR